MLVHTGNVSQDLLSATKKKTNQEILIYQLKQIKHLTIWEQKINVYFFSHIHMHLLWGSVENNKY